MTRTRLEEHAVAAGNTAPGRDRRAAPNRDGIAIQIGGESEDDINLAGGTPASSRRVAFLYWGLPSRPSTGYKHSKRKLWHYYLKVLSRQAVHASESDPAREKKAPAASAAKVAGPVARGSVGGARAVLEIVKRTGH